MEPIFFTEQTHQILIGITPVESVPPQKSESAFNRDTAAWD